MIKLRNYKLPVQSVLYLRKYMFIKDYGNVLYVIVNLKHLHICLDVENSMIIGIDLKKELLSLLVCLIKISIDI
jgi:hypothetical protein